MLLSLLLYIIQSAASNTDLVDHRSESNPLGCAVAITALEVLEREKLAERSLRLGEIFRSELRALNSPLIKLVRGRGLFNGVVIDESKSVKGRTAWQLCLLMKSKGYVWSFSLWDPY